MREKSKSILILIILMLFIFTSCDMLSELEAVNQQDHQNEMTSNIQVHFIDVDQGDATLIKSDKGNILIDGGDNKTEDMLVEYLQTFGVTSIDFIIATHPHSDHIGGLDKVIENFNIKNVIMPNVTHTTRAFERFIISMEDKKIKPTIPKVGEKYKVGDIDFTILSPAKNDYTNLNNYSVTIKLEYGDVSFIFAGDAEKEIEQEILDSGFDISADIYKVSHHGSSTSSTKEFVEKISPKIGIISCGLNNDYGHPHKEIVKVLQDNNVEFLRTDEEGTIILTTDGTDISFNTGKILRTEDLIKDEEKFIDKDGNGNIKGNINSKGEKIYHMPDGVYYERTVAEKYFKTEKEALDNGFRRSSQ